MRTADTVSGWRKRPSKRPVVLLVDGDTELLASMEAAATRHYDNVYDVVAAPSPSEALITVAGLHGMGAALALVVAEQSLPEMTGAELLRQTRRLFPGAVRVLATGMEKAGSAFAAIRADALDYFLVKPWEPLAEKFFPVLDRLLDEWRERHRAEVERIRVAGSRWSSESYEIKEFLSRNHVPYLWVDVEQDAAARELVESLSAGKLRLPVVFLPDGRRLVAPTRSEVAAAVGLRTEAEEPFYDLVVIGAGPAGLANAVYATSEGLATLVVEQSAPGGQAGSSSMIENYLGFPAGVSGADLAQRAMTQAKRFGAEFLSGEVVGVRRQDPFKIVQLASGKEIHCYAVVIATGMKVRRLEVEGIDPLLGIGVYYGAAMTEAATYRGQEICLVGGRNSAGQGALFFSRYVKKVTMLVRTPGLAPWMSQYLVERIESASNIEVVPGVEVAAVRGEGRLEQVVVRDTKSCAERAIDASGLFIFIGAAPRSEMFAELIECDERGFILTGPELPRVERKPKGWPLEREPLMFETSVPGVFAVGDVRAGANRRVAAAVGEGSAAIYSVHRYLMTV